MHGGQNIREGDAVRLGRLLVGALEETGECGPGVVAGPFRVLLFRLGGVHEAVASGNRREQDDEADEGAEQA